MIKGNRKIINIGIVYIIIIFIALFFSITLLFLKTFEFKPAKQCSQYQEDNIYKNLPETKAQNFFRNILIVLCIIFFGIFSSYKLIKDPCQEDTTKSPAKDFWDSLPEGFL